ncbi:NUDIX hydrolase [Candidatus Woesearchaeota archaeon]|nr:NUDIX hydrolase [Candidatus Woesearchaeota archaeon]
MGEDDISKKNEGAMNSVDIIFDINGKEVLLVKRKAEPYKGYWGLPGGKQEPFEKLESAVVRVLKQRLNLDVSGDFSQMPNVLVFNELKKEAELHQIRTYDSGADPRGGNTTVFAIQLHISPEKLMKVIKPGFKVAEVKLVSKQELPKLAFDHLKFINDYYKYLKPYKDSAKTYDSSKYEKPSVTADMLIFTIRNNELQVLLIKRKSWPFKGMWAIPGGFVGLNEPIDEAAKRELLEETGVKDVYLEQLYTFGKPERDPRTRVITIAYYALISSANVKLEASTDAADVAWLPVDNIPKLAFDHNEIVDYAISRIRNKIEYTNIAFQLLPEKFTLSELQKVYEVILGKKLDKRNFRKKVKETRVLIPSKDYKMEGAHRPAQLFSFKEKGQSILKASKKV